MEGAGHRRRGVRPREALGPEANEERPPEADVLRALNHKRGTDAALLEVKSHPAARRCPGAAVGPSADDAARAPRLGRHGSRSWSGAGRS
eukprot:6898956-Alexandrium_andersonii.AAC.1